MRLRETPPHLVHERRNCSYNNQYHSKPIARRADKKKMLLLFAVSSAAAVFNLDLYGFLLSGRAVRHGHDEIQLNPVP